MKKSAAYAASSGMNSYSANVLGRAEVGIEAATEK